MKRFLALFLAVSMPAWSTTYYVSYTHGADTNNGTAKATPWQHAPGMNNCASNCNITPGAGDSIIFEGCVTWPNAAFSWAVPSGGTSGNNTYYGVDKTWWDSTVTGCTSAWNRPIFNLGAATVTDSLQRIIMPFTSYTTLDNFEITNFLDADSNHSGENETHVFDVGNYILIENMYIHGWVDEFFSVGTGNLTSGSSTVTNFVPYAYSPQSPSSSWIGTGAGQSDFIIVGTIGSHGTGGGTIPQTGNGAQVTAITGSNPYSITWTSSGSATGNCTGCVITVGGDFLMIFAGNESGNPGTVVQNSVIDGSDSSSALLNPYGDCGASESDNQICLTSGIAQWRGPQIFRNNVIRYVASVAVGACTEWSGNLLEYIRFSTNASAHTNGIECLDEQASNNAILFYNNVFRHTNVANASEPHGQSSIGLGWAWSAPTGTTAYEFNNVTYDTLQNAWFGPSGSGYGCTSNCGANVAFNNSSDGGPSWSLTYAPSSACPSVMSSCTFENNHWITGSASQFIGGSCGSNCTVTTDLLQSVATANGQGYSESETYAYSPINGSGSTVGAGSSISSYCTAITSANAAAGAACADDTTYAASEQTIGGVVQAVSPTRVVRVRKSTPDIGAYEYLVPSGATFSGATVNGATIQ